jgi:hypothetical protein
VIVDLRESDQDRNDAGGISRAPILGNGLGRQEQRGILDSRCDNEEAVQVDRIRA